ncbi:MAG: hypothetical protein OXF74_05415 [Rhodobacteraceae bacterium]|nr:hypothetical protein [Paracoccaceae bacterium]
MYLSDYFLNWLAARVAGQAITVSLHTGAPGDSGTANRATGNNGQPGVTVTIPANAISADGARVDNDSVVNVFTPNGTSAGQSISHLGYWFGGSFVGWAQATAARTTVSGEAFPIDAAAVAFTFALRS